MTIRSGPGASERQPKFIDVRGCLDGNDALVLCPVDQKIARGREDELPGILRNFGQRSFINAHIDILPEIGKVARIAPIAFQKLHQQLLKRQDFSIEPFVRRRHGRSSGGARKRHSRRAAKIRNLVHSPAFSPPIGDLELGARL